MKISKRERIMTHLKERFEAIQSGIDGFSTTWNQVTRQPLSKSAVAMGDCLGLFDIREEKTPHMQFMLCTLTVVVEFYSRMQLGDDPATELNRMLLDVQRTFRSDIQCGGLALNIVETKNELDIDGPGDSLVAGVVEVQVQYRHYVDDPSS
jgi:hypothetical protein